MPVVPSISPATGLPTSSSFIHTTDCNFVDNAGRTLLLRGVNLSGSSKAPVGRPSYILEDFWENAEEGGESFVGRPLNIDDGSADVHLARLSGWGFNLLRFPVTWESLEHEGPGKYDYDFMDYTIRVLYKCKQYGFKVYMDPHQDIWSRFSGGSGAPFWTLAACGIEPRNLTACQAAIIHSEYPLAHDPDPATLPAMIWSTNYGRLLSQTIFTLFFAGRDFAPNAIIDDQNIQDYLQQHYIEAMGQMADRIRDAPGLMDDCVIGWDSMNEPFEGLCGWDDLNTSPTKQGSTLKKGTYPTPAQSLRLGMGQAQTVDNWSFGMWGPARDGTVTIDPKGHKMWADPKIEKDGVHPKWGWKRSDSWKLGTCIWAQHGVWDVQTGYVLRRDHFKYLPNGEEVEFIADYWRPHWSSFTKRIRASHPEAIMFVQPPVFAPPPIISDDELRGRCAYSGHYYDGLTLVTRHWNWFNADALGLLRGKYTSTLRAVKIGEKAIRKSLQEQLGMLKEDTKILGSFPTVIGEIGTPFDMDSKRSYGWTDGGKYKGDYSRQERALDASLNGADGDNSMNWTIWTYCPDHGHDWGDGWNMEDLSLWSPDDCRREKYLEDDDDSSIYRGMMGESQAVLVRKSKVNVMGGTAISVRAAAASSLSLATLGLGSGNVFDEMRVRERKKSGRELAGWRENPYEFLKNGARAEKAFCRPWPCKVVGRSVDICFDVKKTTFKLVVSVRSDDRLKEGGVDDHLPATEVYIPLVHYAHQKYLPKGRGEKDSDTRSVASTFDGRLVGDRMASRTASLFDLGAGAAPLPRDDYDDASASSSATATALSSPVLSSIVPRDMVDVEVKVSEGKWSVDGQTLKWWYDVPAEGEPKKELTLELRRKGGAIGTKSFKQRRSSLCAKLCPSEDRCCIM